MPSSSSPVAGLPADRVRPDHEDARTPVVLVHGFSQTRRSWDPLISHLSDQSLVVPDLPGHGAARHDEAGLVEIASLVAATTGPAVFVGYSMGGRVALRVALDHPAVTRGLILIGATAGIDDPVERADRRRADEELADRIERHGTVEFLDRWLAQPMFAALEVSDDDLRARRTNRPEGLAASLRNAGTGTMDPPWWSDLRSVECPTLVVVGEHDHKFAGLGRRLVSSIGRSATMVSIPDAGHAAHLEEPGRVAQVITGFLAGPAGLAGPADQGM